MAEEEKVDVRGDIVSGPVTQMTVEINGSHIQQRVKARAVRVRVKQLSHSCFVGKYSHSGNPPALPEDSRSMTVPGVIIFESGNEPKCPWWAVVVTKYIW